jgi:hypothetical protein
MSEITIFISIFIVISLKIEMNKEMRLSVDKLLEVVDKKL